MGEGARVQVADRSSADDRVDALVIPVVDGPAPGPGLREVASALGTDLLRMLRD